MNFQTLLNNTTTKRDTLKPAFNVGEIPTQQHFYDMIDGLFLQDDTVYKDANNGLAIQAGSDANKTALLLYADATSEPAWQLGIANGFELKDTAGNTQLMVTNDGKVGVGTTSPDAALRVDTMTSVNENGTGSNNAHAIAKFLNSSDSTRGLEIGAPSGGVVAPVYLKVSGTESHFSIVNQYDQENLTVLHGGNVGIGTTSPVTKLHVQDGAMGTVPENAMVIFESNQTRYLQLMIPATTYETGVLFGKGTDYVHGGIIYDKDNAMHLRTGGNQTRLFLHSNSNVGIGTTSPQARLHITNGDLLLQNQSGTGYPSLWLKNVGDTDHLRIDYNTIQNTSGNPLYIRSNGHVLINDHVGGGSVAIGASHSSGFKLLVAGSIYAFGSVNENSDQRFKKNISPISGAVTKLGKLQGKTFQWRTKEFKEKNFSEGTKLGFIAQEVQEVFPELVQEGTDGYLSISYTGLIPVLTEAHKQQQQTIEAQQAQIDNLVERMVALENLLAAAKS